MNDPQIQQVSDTALMAAAYRAVETDRQDALFHDPLAAKVAGHRGRKIIESLPRQAFVGGWTVAIRTRVIDDLLRQAIAEGVDTVLNLGAGLDTRPYRMELPAGLRWVEVDQPHVMELKSSRLSSEGPRCRLERIGLDLADGNARRKLLAEVAAQSKMILVLTEAVTPYLPEEAVAALAAELQALDSVTFWVVDYFAPAAYEYRRRSGMSQAMKNAPFVFEPMDYFGFFRKAGWVPRETRYFAEEGERLRRPPPFPFGVRLVTRILGLFASAERRRGMKRYAGIVLFGRAGSA
jgi:methyltransferase (TIGR00027 family)